MVKPVDVCKYMCISLNCCAFVMDMVLTTIQIKFKEDTLLINIIFILLSLLIHAWAIYAALEKDPKGLLIVSFVFGVYTSLLLYRAINVTKDFKEVAKEEIRRAWNDDDIAQYEKKLKCCGKRGPTDYDAKKIPDSCYTEGREGDPDYLYKHGCLEKYYEKRIKFYGGLDMIVRWFEFSLNLLCTAFSSAMVYFYLENLFPSEVVS